MHFKLSRTAIWRWTIVLVYTLALGHFAYSNLVRTIGPHFRVPRDILSGPCQDPGGFVSDEQPGCPRYSCPFNPDPAEAIILFNGEVVTKLSKINTEINRGFPFQRLWLQDYDHCSSLKIAHRTEIAPTFNLIYLALITTGAVIGWRHVGRSKSVPQIN